MTRAASITIVSLGLGCAFLVGLVVGTGSQPEPSPEPTGAGPDPARASLAALAAEVAELRGVVEELGPLFEASRVAPAAAAPARRPVDAESVPAGGSSPLASGPPLEAILARLAELELALLDEHATTREAVRSSNSATGLVERMRSSGREVDWAEWEPLLDTWRTDRQAANKELKLLTVEELIERFGPPTDVWTNQNGLTWQYARDFDPVDEKYRQEIILRVPDGYVTQFWVRER